MACPILTSSHSPQPGSAKRAGRVKVEMKSHILPQQNLIPGDIRVLIFCKLAVLGGVLLIPQNLATSCLVTKQAAGTLPQRGPRFPQVLPAAEWRPGPGCWGRGVPKGARPGVCTHECDDPDELGCYRPMEGAQRAAFGDTQLLRHPLQEKSAPSKSLAGGGAVEAGMIVQFLGSAGSKHPAEVLAEGSLQRFSSWMAPSLQRAAWMPSIKQRK